MPRIPVALQRKGFLYNVLLLVSGAGAAQLITVLVSPLLSRLYTPDDFAVIGVFMSLVSLITMISGCRYELAIVTVRHDAVASSLFVLCNMILLGVVSLVCVAALCFSSGAAELLGVPALAGVFWLLPLAILFSGWQLFLSFWITRRNRFASQAMSDVLRATGTAGAQISLATITEGGGPALVIGQCFGFLLSSVSFMGRVLWEDMALLRRGLNKMRLKFVAWKYRHFFYYQTPKSLINTAVNDLPVVLVSIYFGAVAAGLYWFIYRLILMPVNLLGKAVNRVFLKRISDLHHKNRPILPILLKITLLLTGSGLGLTLAFYLLGPQRFTVIFGDKWHDAWAYGVWLTAWFTFRMSSNQAQSIFVILQRQSLQFWLEAPIGVLRLGIVPLCAFLGYAALDTVAIYALGGALSNIILIAAAFLLARTHDQARIKSPA